MIARDAHVHFPHMRVARLRTEKLIIAVYVRTCTYNVTEKIQPLDACTTATTTRTKTR